MSLAKSVLLLLLFLIPIRNCVKVLKPVNEHEIFEEKDASATIVGSSFNDLKLEKTFTICARFKVYHYFSASGYIDMMGKKLLVAL